VTHLDFTVLPSSASGSVERELLLSSSVMPVQLNLKQQQLAAAGGNSGKKQSEILHRIIYAF
jgi:hypothetical protein